MVLTICMLLVVGVIIFGAWVTRQNPAAQESYDFALADPLAGQDAATKEYVDLVTLRYDPKEGTTSKASGNLMLTKKSGNKKRSRDVKKKHKKRKKT